MIVAITVIRMPIIRAILTAILVVCLVVSLAPVLNGQQTAIHLVYVALWGSKVPFDQSLQANHKAQVQDYRFSPYTNIPQTPNPKSAPVPSPKN